MTQRIELKPGQRFGKLVVQKQVKSTTYECVCDCGGLKEVSTSALRSGNIKSCGCLKVERIRQRREQIGEASRKYPPRIASARRRWQAYSYVDNQCIGFDDFLRISQKDCFYCGASPSNLYNKFLKCKNASQKAMLEGDFWYNGIDRKDSNRAHTIDNIVPCCHICNRYKSDMSVEKFLDSIINLRIVSFTPIKITERLTSERMLTIAKCVFYKYRKDTDLTIEELYSLSQMNCFYCDRSPDNRFTYDRGEPTEFVFSGIDRIDSSLGHLKTNVVPCCYYCNFAKGKLSFDEFMDWIRRIKEYQAIRITLKSP